jgi:hypothetical protein
MMAQGGVDGRMAQAGIAAVISRCNIRDDRNEKKSTHNLIWTVPSTGFFGALIRKPNERIMK